MKDESTAASTPANIWQSRGKIQLRGQTGVYVGPSTDPASTAHKGVVVNGPVRAGTIYQKADALNIAEPGTSVVMNSDTQPLTTIRTNGP